MTHTNQTFSSIGTGVRFTFAAAGDSYFVSAPAIVESTNNIAIRGSHGDESVTVQGWVKSSFIALYFDEGSDIVEVGRTGGVSSSLSSISNSCIAFVGGNSTLINQGKIAEAQPQFLRWNKAEGKVLKGLTRRRLAEAVLWGPASADYLVRTYKLVV